MWLGPEIWKDTAGKVDIFVAGCGTGGTITGTGRYLKTKNPSIKLICVEPTESPIISGGEPGPHQIQGIGPDFIPAILDTSQIDEIVTVTTQESMDTTRRLAREERRRAARRHIFRSTRCCLLEGCRKGGEQGKDDRDGVPQRR